METRKRRACAAIAFWAALAVLHAGADTFTTDAVGFVRFDGGQNQSVSVSNPFVRKQEPMEAEELADHLAATSTAGDYLHIWTGFNFNSYELKDGVWKVFETDTAAPAGRLTRDIGLNGVMVTHNSPGTINIAFTGALPDADAITLQMAAGEWTMVNFPFAIDIKLNDVNWNGAGDGDRIRIWNSAGAAWRLFQRIDGAWVGDGVSDLIVPAGTPFIYFNSSVAIRTLRFTNPISLE